MITYDGLRVLVMAEDDSRRCVGLFAPPSQPKNRAAGGKSLPAP